MSTRSFSPGSIGSRPIRALSPQVADLPSQLARIIGIWIERRRQRRALAALSSAMLKDVGIAPGDAYRESSKPFWCA
jgi:uncharacterized protein YjiS (DUF1127 family)